MAAEPEAVATEIPAADLNELRPTIIDVARVAKALLRAIAADVVILTGDKVWRASNGALEASETPLVDIVVHRNDVVWIENMLEEPTLRELGVVTGDPHLRFFAGAPILLENGACVGALAVYDTATQAYDAKLAARLGDLARIVARDFARIRAVRERAESEETMARQEERFRIAIENAGLHVYELDFAKRQLFKAGAEDTFFITPKTYRDLARDPFVAVHAEDRAAAEKTWAECLAEGRPFRYEYRMDRGDGSNVWTFSTCRLILDENGAPLRLVGALQDISNRKRVETEIAQSRAQAEATTTQLRFALEAAHAAAWSMDIETGALTGLDDLSQVVDFEVTPADVAAMSPRIAHPEDRPKVVDFVKAIRGGGRHEVEHRFVAPDGSVKWAHSSGQAILDGPGRGKLVFLTINTTNRRALEMEFAEALNQAASSLESKRSLLDSIVGELGQAPIEPVARTSAPAAPSAVRPTGGDLHERLASLLSEIDLRDKAIANAVGALKESRGAAEAANIAKSQFVANMSHELRTPLNAVIGYAEILQEDLEDAGMTEPAKDASRIRNAARNLLGLINDILDLSKIEAGKMDAVVSEVDIKTLVEDAVQTVTSAAAAKNNTLEVTLAPYIGTARTDETRLRQCLLNLLSNACKFMEDGVVRLNVSRELGREGEMLRLVVSDTGIGLTEEQMGRLFQAFTQADATTTRKFGGTGLGLVITRKFAQLLGGDVTVQSVAGEGATFTLLVRADMDRAVAETPDQETAGPLVLVIDDEADARDLVKRCLARLGCGARSTAFGIEGLALARELAPHAIVLDIALPDLPGWDVLMALQSDPLTSNIPVIILSVEDDPLRAAALGAREHLVKPVDRTILSDAVMRAIETNKLDDADLEVAS